MNAHQEPFGEEISERPEKPVPSLQGTFAIYALPDGGVLIAWRKMGTQKDERIAIPAFVVNMAAQASREGADSTLANILSGNV